ncbi:MAG: tRNA preQ1(34) S-adenosylmethionine ribosyltransferase-isomerase QueA [Chloroflexi bacterium]|nr:tRNA preQ1(34) S-adenosylmethionine ribosyltransferase-isomerase QueA [Chloroflexota bacterium]
MRTSDFDYSLPRESIAQTPVEPRDHARLLRLDRSTGALSHHHFYDLPSLLRKGDLLVLNDSRVLPARLYGRRAGTGGQVELLLLRRERPGVWQCLGRPGRGLRVGAMVECDGGLQARVVERGGDGLLWVELSDEARVEQVGRMPLPPYIHAPLLDKERYQTVYADRRKTGSAAAPTAGLHFTPELLERLAGAGVETAYVTLHVGLDTFRPVEEDDPREHKLHTEFWEMPGAAAEAVTRARAEGRRIVAVGTTTVRTLEQAALLAEQAGDGALRAGGGWADLFILPGHRFRLVDALVTNFHLPRSSLLMLVSAFAGRERVLEAYQAAVEAGYRFYSFGDAMLVG